MQTFSPTSGPGPIDRQSSSSKPTRGGESIPAGTSRTEAARLRELGYTVLPLPTRQKEPPPRGWITRREPYDIAPEDNLAIGLRGDVAVLITNDDPATSWATSEFGTPNVKSVRGAHWYFRALQDQANEANRATAVGTLELHVRSKYALVPPSIHPVGTPYAWVRPLPALKELPEAPDLRDLFHPRGQHHTKLLSISAAAAHASKNVAEIFEALRQYRDSHLTDARAHPDRELLQLAESAGLKFSVPGAAASDAEGKALFGEVQAALRGHYFFEDDWHYTMAALFIMQAWAVRAGALPAVFYLYFGGQFSSGKSNILSLIATLSDGLLLENVSPSALARMIENARTVLLDEIDVQRGEELDDVMSALLRSGYRRNGPPYRRWNAKEKQPESIPIFGPKVGTFRSALDPALQSRGFVVPTAKPIGEAHYDLVLANLWPHVSDLVPRLRAWGKQTATRWPDGALEALARTAEFQSRVRKVVGKLGANRESELLTIALLVAQMAGVDVVESLSSATALRAVEISEDQAEAIDEVRLATLDNLSKVIAFNAGGEEVYRVAQKAVRDLVNSRRGERKERPLTTGRLALLRRELGVKDAWLAEKGHALHWNLPRAFVDSIRSPPAGGDTPPGASPQPPHLPSTPPPPPVLPRTDAHSGEADSRQRPLPSGEEGSTRGVPGGVTLNPGACRTPGDGVRRPPDPPTLGPVVPPKAVHSNCRLCTELTSHVCYVCTACRWQENHGPDGEGRGQ